MLSAVIDPSALFAPERIIRDESGLFWHPDVWLLLGDADEVAPALETAGFAVKWIEGDEETFPWDVVVDGGEAYWNAMRSWKPAPPAEGEGWKIAAVADTEWGPQALYVRLREEGMS